MIISEVEVLEVDEELCQFENQNDNHYSKYLMIYLMMGMLLLLQQRQQLQLN
jgi:hypothetical protein